MKNKKTNGLEHEVIFEEYIQMFPFLDYVDPVAYEVLMKKSENRTSLREFEEFEDWVQEPSNNPVKLGLLKKHERIAENLKEKFQEDWAKFCKGWKPKIPTSESRRVPVYLFPKS